MLGYLLDQKDHKAARDDFRLQFYARNAKSSVHKVLNIAFPLNTLKGLIAESFELVPASSLLNLLPCSKNALHCIKAFHITRVSSLKRT
jgi:hypothetical protein